jgi:uncharacterized protein YjgD (DUF1641 family)
MATPLEQTSPDAYEELNNLIQTLHEQGLLRLANDAVASHSQWMDTVGGIVDNTVRKEDLQNTLPALAEFARLLQELHRQGLLELANNAVASHRQWLDTLGGIADDTIRKEDLQNALPALAEFSRLVQALHRQGLLELANNAVESHPQWMETLGGIVDDALNKADSRNLTRNLSVLANLASTVLSRIEPEELNKLLFALGDALEHVAKYKPEGEQAYAPGIMGVYRLCKDESLWRALTPIADAMRVFGRGLDQEGRGGAQAAKES